MSMGGGKLNPEDLFASLRVIRQQAQEEKPAKNFAEKLFERFSNRFTEQEVTKELQ